MVDVLAAHTEGIATQVEGMVSHREMMMSQIKATGTRPRRWPPCCSARAAAPSNIS